MPAAAPHAPWRARGCGLGGPARCRAPIACRERAAGGGPRPGGAARAHRKLPGAEGWRGGRRSGVLAGRKHPRAGGAAWKRAASGDGEARGQGGLRWGGRDPPPYGHPDQAHRWPTVGFTPAEFAEHAAAIESQLLLLTSALAGLCTPAEAAAGAGTGVRFNGAGPVGMVVDRSPGAEEDTRVGGDGGATVVRAGELLLAPAFMSAAAEAQVEAAVQAIGACHSSKSTL
eukprot:COSAG05_NODE_463_length_9555_cov_35.796108_5_plen_229_part_00